MPRKVEKVIRTLIGISAGFLLAYVFGALIGQDFNPCHWHWLLKLGVFLAGTVWGLVSAACVAVGLASAHEEEALHDT